MAGMTDAVCATERRACDASRRILGDRAAPLPARIPFQPRPMQFARRDRSFVAIGWRPDRRPAYSGSIHLRTDRRSNQERKMNRPKAASRKNSCCALRTRRFGWTRYRFADQPACFDPPCTVATTMTSGLRDLDTIFIKIHIPIVVVGIVVAAIHVDRDTIPWLPPQILSSHARSYRRRRDHRKAPLAT